MKTIPMKKFLFLSCFLFFIMTLSTSGYGQSYVPPIGIPAPEFGIDETVENIYGAGYYTHYIDNTHPNATDVDNPNGTPEKPRKTLTKRWYDIPAGSVIEVHGGPYSYISSPRWTGAGTQEQPVFFRGGDPDNPPVISGVSVRLGGQYLILENFKFSKSSISTGLYTPGHISVRHCEFSGLPGNAVIPSGEHIVVYNNHIHHNVKTDITKELDAHGVVPGAGARYVWVLDNHIHDNSGDAFQGTHGASDNPAQFVYVGRNVMHDDRENGVDLKYIRDIVISQNIMYGYENAPGVGASSGSDGSAVILGSDGMPNRAWVLFNEIYDCRNGIRNEDTDRAWIIGNKIYNIEGFGIALEKKSDDLYIIGNTINDVNVAIDQYGWNSFRLHIFNNIFANIRKSSVHLDIRDQAVADASEMGYNLFWQPGGNPFIVRWASSNMKNYYSTSDFDGFAGGTNNIIGDPLFDDAANGNFYPQEGSAAIDSGFYHAVYDTFFAMHGVDIRKDFDGRSRPLLSGWDMGAFEYTGAPSSIDRQKNFPLQFSLQQNYPNPFNPTTTIQFNLAKRSHVRLEIFNTKGQIVTTLVTGYYDAGADGVDWNGRDRNDRQVVSGIYFYRLITAEQILTRKMLLVR